MAKQPPDVVSGAYPLYGNKYIQFGSLSPWTGDATDESDASIRTNLTSIDVGIVTLDDTSGVSIGTDGAGTNYFIQVERVVSSGAFLVVRDTQSASLGTQSFSYLIIGDIDATD